MPDDSIWGEEPSLPEKNGRTPAEEVIEEPTPARFEYDEREIENYLRSIWGNERYEQSAFRQMLVQERDRASRLKARPKKGK